jgi:hypothetical protein
MWKISNGFTNLGESGYFSTLDIVLRLCDGCDQASLACLRDGKLFFAFGKEGEGL